MLSHALPCGLQRCPLGGGCRVRDGGCRGTEAGQAHPAPRTTPPSPWEARSVRGPRSESSSRGWAALQGPPGCFPPWPPAAWARAASAHLCRAAVPGLSDTAVWWTEPVAWGPPTPGFWFGMACGEYPRLHPLRAVSAGLMPACALGGGPVTVALQVPEECREGGTLGPAPSPGQDSGPGVSAGPTGHRPQCAWASGFASSARTPGTGRS